MFGKLPVTNTTCVFDQFNFGRGLRIKGIPLKDMSNSSKFTLTRNESNSETNILSLCASVSRTIIGRIFGFESSGDRARPDAPNKGGDPFSETAEFRFSFSFWERRLPRSLTVATPLVDSERWIRRAY